MRLFLFFILIPFLTFGQVYYSQNNSIYETDLDGSYFDLIYTGNNSIKSIEMTIWKMKFTGLKITEY